MLREYIFSLMISNFQLPVRIHALGMATEFSPESAVFDYHVYLMVWSPVVGEELTAEREPTIQLHMRCTLFRSLLFCGSNNSQ